MLSTINLYCLTKLKNSEFKSKKWLTTLAFGVLLFHFTDILFCQSAGYIVTSDKALHGGYIKIAPGKSNSVYYKRSRNSEFELYKAPELIEYGLRKGNSYYYRTIPVTDKSGVSMSTTFIEKIVEGKMNLYRTKSHSRYHFYIEKSDSKLVELQRNKIYSRNYFKNRSHFIDTIEFHMSDCDQVKDACKLVKPNSESLIRLVNRYNNCSNKILPKFRIGLYANLEYTNISFPEWRIANEKLNHSDFKKSFTQSIGIYFDFPVWEYISFQMELGYANNNYSINNDLEDNGTIVSEDILFEIMTGNSRLAVRYSFLTPKLRPYALGGIVVKTLLDSEDLWFQATDNNGTVNIIQKEWPLQVFSNNYFGYYGGIGLNYSLNHRFSVFLEGRIETTHGVDGPGTPCFSSYSIVSGINF